MAGSGASHVTVAVGVDANTAAGTAHTAVCAGAYTNGSGPSHGIVTGVKASTAVGRASSVICAGANSSGCGVSHGTVRSFETSSSACIVCAGVGAGSRSKVTKEGIGASHVIVAAGIDARSAAGTASTGVCSGASLPSRWGGHAVSGSGIVSSLVEKDCRAMCRGVSACNRLQVQPRGRGDSGIIEQIPPSLNQLETVIVSSV